MGARLHSGRGIERVEKHRSVRALDGLVHLGENACRAAGDEFDTVLTGLRQPDLVSFQIRRRRVEHSVEFEDGDPVLELDRTCENREPFKLDRVKTPVLFMANDNDGAVPWYQGIEFYVAMRRLRKEAYMVVYNGDEHNPTKRANQKDIDKKMQEFFATKLQGAPPADWMERGVPQHVSAG